MSSTLTLLLVMSLAGSAPSEAQRDAQAVLAAVVLEMTDVSVDRAPAPVARAEERDVSFYYGDLHQIHDVPVEQPVLITYDLSLPIFRDFL